MFYVYILRCNDDTLYTGYTVNLKNRLKRHNQGLGAKYTRGRRPVRLVYFEEIKDKGDALRREYYIKSLTRNQKLNLIRENPYSPNE